MGNNCTQWTSPVPIQYQGRGQTDGNFPRDLRVIALFPHEYSQVSNKRGAYNKRGGWGKKSTLLVFYYINS